MRSRKKQLMHQKVFQNLPVEPTPETPIIQWKTTPKIPMRPNATALQTAPTPPLLNEQLSLQLSQNSTKHIINTLITQNSELRKTIYRLEHSMAIMRLNIENKELQYKNVIFEYRQMIEGLVENMGYSSVEEYENSLNSEAKEQASWEARRLHLYDRYEGCEVESKNNRKLGSNISQSRRSKSLNKSISIRIDKENNLQEDPQQDQSADEKPFALDPCDFLNFNTSVNIQQPAPDRKEKLKSLSSVTEILHPFTPQNYIQIDQIPTTNYQPKQTRETAHVSKAQTQRIQKVSTRDKKSSGRVSSQAAYSNQSFKIIVQKGMKNRERIEQLFGKLKAA